MADIRKLSSRGVTRWMLTWRDPTTHRQQRMVFGNLSLVKTGIYSLVDMVGARTLDDQFEKVHALVRCVPPGTGLIGNDFFPVMVSTRPRNDTTCPKASKDSPRRRR